MKTSSPISISCPRCIGMSYKLHIQFAKQILLCHSWLSFLHILIPMQLLDDMFYIARLLNFSIITKKLIMKVWLVWCTSILMQGKSQRYNVTALSHWTKTQTKKAEREKVAKQGVRNYSPDTWFFDNQCRNTH